MIAMRFTLWVCVLAFSASVAAHGFVKSVNIDGAMSLILVKSERF
jgi:hypothetical protein